VIVRELEAAAVQEQRPLRDAQAAAQMFMAAVPSLSSPQVDGCAHRFERRLRRNSERATP
jgi:hypothetical protein